MSNDNVIRVAVIDNQKHLGDVSTRLLENAGFKVLFQTDNGQQALEKIVNNNLPDVCIVEEDFASAKLLLDKYPDLNVLISSTDDDEESVRDMLKMGLRGYILKHADPYELITAVKALVTNRKYFSVGVAKIAQDYFSNK